MNLGLEGRRALVVGGSVGMGRGVVLALAGAGARVMIADIDEAGAAETLALAGGDGAFVRCDVTEPGAGAAAVAAAVDAFGGLDCAVNNAGLEGPRVNTAELEDEEWDRMIAVNLTGVWRCMKPELAALRAGGGGAIVNTASVGGLAGLAGRPAYNAAKHGVIGLTKTAAVEFAGAGIRINAVCPAFMRTPMSERVSGAELDRIGAERTPLGRIAEIEEMGAAVAWLCSDAASFVTGVALPVDGGFLAGGPYLRAGDGSPVLFERAS